ncbi:hypothetical protein D3C76_1248690 [compost metagenome]
MIPSAPSFHLGMNQSQIHHKYFSVSVLIEMGNYLIHAGQIVVIHGSDTAKDIGVVIFLQDRPDESDISRNILFIINGRRIIVLAQINDDSFGNIQGKVPWRRPFAERPVKMFRQALLVPYRILPSANPANSHRMIFRVQHSGADSDIGHVSVVQVRSITDLMRMPDSRSIRDGIAKVFKPERFGRGWSKEASAIRQRKMVKHNTSSQNSRPLMDL